MLAIAIFVVCYFVYGDIKNKNENYNFILHDLSFQNDKQDYLASKLKTVENISAEINAIDNSIVSKNDEVGFIESLESLARENGLSIEISSLTLDNSASLASSTMNILNVKAKTSGSWLGNYTFLSRLESLPFKVKINMVGLTNSSSGAVSDVNNSNPSNDTWQSVFDIGVLEYK
jgi:hypothetical protein